MSARVQEVDGSIESRTRYRPQSRRSNEIDEDLLRHANTRVMTVLEDGRTTGRLLTASADGHVYGSTLISWGGDGPFDQQSVERLGIELFKTEMDPHQILVCHPPMINVSHGVWASARAMIHAVMEFGFEHDVEVYLIECELDQLPIYEWLGFRPYRRPQSGNLRNLRLPMALVASDVRHLRQIRSPLFACAFARRKSSATNPLLPLIESQDAIWSAPRNPQNPLWEDLVRLVRKTDTNGRGFFASLSNAALRALLRHSLILNCPSNQTVVNSDDPRPHVFLILSGKLEARSEGVVAGELSAGDIFGVTQLQSGDTPSLDLITLTDNVSILLLEVRAILKNKSWVRACLSYE